MVSSHLKNLSQVGSFPQIGVNILKKYMKTTTQTHHWCQPIKSAFTPNAHRQACDLTGPCNVGRRDLKLAVGSFHMLVWVYCPLTYIIVDGHLKGEISNPPPKKKCHLVCNYSVCGLWLRSHHDCSFGMWKRTLKHLVGLRLALFYRYIWGKRQHEWSLSRDPHFFCIAHRNLLVLINTW